MTDTSWYVAARGAVLPWDSPDTMPWPRHPWGRKPRESASDVLPEHLIYRDEGCDLAPKCLECPLTDGCRYDLPPKRARAALREQQFRDLLDQGFTVQDAALRLGVSARTAFRMQRHLMQPATVTRLIDADAWEQRGIAQWNERGKAIWQQSPHPSSPGQATAKGQRIDDHHV